MFAQIIVTLLIMIGLFTIGYKFVVLPLTAALTKSKAKKKLRNLTQEELDQELATLRAHRNELELKEKSVEVLKQIKDVDERLAAVNEIRNELRS